MAYHEKDRQLIDDEELLRRREMYLANHYTQLYATLVSVVLGVAGISAAGLLGNVVDWPAYYLLMVGMWGAAFLATVISYTGMLTGTLALPSRLPFVHDAIVPMILGVTEFMLFAALSDSLVSPSLEIHHRVSAWHFSYFAYALSVVAVMWRASYLYGQADYPPKIQARINRYRSALTGGNSWFALGGGLANLAAGVVTLWRGTPGWWNSGVVALTWIILVFGLLSMEHLGNLGRTSAEVTETRPTTDQPIEASEATTESGS